MSVGKVSPGESTIRPTFNSQPCYPVENKTQAQGSRFATCHARVISCSVSASMRTTQERNLDFQCTPDSSVEEPALALESTGRDGTRCCCSGCRVRSCCGSPFGSCSHCCSKNRREGSPFRFLSYALTKRAFPRIFVLKRYVFENEAWAIQLLRRSRTFATVIRP